MILNRKAQFNSIKTILIILISSIIFLTYMIILSTNKMDLDERKVDTQILIKEIFNQNCFGDEKGIFEYDKFSQDNLNNCFNQDVNDYLFAKLVLGNTDLSPIYYGDVDEFNVKKQLCSYKSPSILCTKLIYPIILKKNNGDLMEDNLILYVISVNK